jgi:hypothetical protein
MLSRSIALTISSNGPEAAALSSAALPEALLQQGAPKLSIDQPGLDLRHRRA